MEDRRIHLLEVVEVRVEHLGDPREEIVDALLILVVCRVPQQRQPELESRLHQVDLVKTRDRQHRAMLLWYNIS